VRRVYFATDVHAGQSAVVLGWLDVLSDGYMNRHLVFGVLELLVVRVIPDVATNSVGEMLDNKLGLNGASS